MGNSVDAEGDGCGVICIINSGGEAELEESVAFDAKSEDFLARISCGRDR